MNNTPETPVPVPAHIPEHLVRDFDLWAELTAQGENAYTWAAELHQTTPPVFWIPRLGFLPGIWVPRRAEDLRCILQDPQTFSGVGLTPYALLLGESWRLAPLEIDPPEHAKYRALLNPSRLFLRRRNADPASDWLSLASIVARGFIGMPYLPVVLRSDHFLGSLRNPTGINPLATNPSALISPRYNMNTYQICVYIIPGAFIASNDPAVRPRGFGPAGK